MGDKIIVLEIALLYGHLYQIDYLNETKGYTGRMFIEKDRFEQKSKRMTASDIVTEIVDEIFGVSAYSEVQIEQAERLIAKHDDEVRREFADKLRKNITAAIDSNIKAMSETKSEELYFTCNGKKTACQGILDYIDELVGEEGQGYGK